MDSPEDKTAEENLYQLWMKYIAKNDISLFKEYLKQFLECFKEYIDVEYAHLSEGFTHDGPHLTRLPDGLLQVAVKQLSICSETCLIDLSPQNLQYAEQLVKCLIIISRNLDNIAFIASCEYVSPMVVIASVVLGKLSEENAESVGQLTLFIAHVLHFLECMYDPYFIWRKQLRGWPVDRSRLKFRPALLHVEVVPFFYECFQQANLDLDIQTRLFHLFGAIIAGVQNNALRAICPATLDVLLKVLRQPHSGGPSNVQRHLVVSLKELVLRLFIRMVQVVHTCSPDQRQVEVGAVLDGYFDVLVRLANEQPSEYTSRLQLVMLNGIVEMLQCTDRAELQVVFVATGTFEHLLAFMHQNTLSGIDGQNVAMAMIRVMNAVMQDSPTAKEKFKEKSGYVRFVEALKHLGQPSRELIKTLLDLVVEMTFEADQVYMIRNTPAALVLVQWLPDIQCQTLQTFLWQAMKKCGMTKTELVWLAQSLRALCATGNHNRMLCCQEGMVATILTVLQKYKAIHKDAVGELISLLESLGTLSITAAELGLLIALLRPDSDGRQNPYCGTLMHAMSAMARKENRVGALYYFDFQSKDCGIQIPSIRKWLGSGFAFHAWVCLDLHTMTSADMDFNRRVLYSFMTSAGNGFEAFFTPEGILVVAVSVKKEYHCIAVEDFPLVDQQWHCIDIVHSSASRPFSQSQLCVYMDGRLRLSAQIKFPTLSEVFTVCRIGDPLFPGEGIFDVPTSPEAMASKSKILPFSLFKGRFKGAAESASVRVIPAGAEDEEFGAPVSVQGQIGPVCLFCEALTATQVSCLFSVGPNDLGVFQSEESALTDLSQKLVLQYNAKACQNGMCMDLSSNAHHARVIGHKCATCDIKDVINCVGGIQVIFPLLEQMGKVTNEEENKEVVQKERDSPAQEKELDDEWVVVRSSSYADSKLGQNQVAGFLALLRNMVSYSPYNQECLVRTNACATLGALLQRLEPSLIDVHVLMALQLLVEAVSEINRSLLLNIYQFLLFDFRIWSKSSFPVRIGHIQYLSTLIKEDRKYFRKKYGVQFMLDIIRVYYSGGDDYQLPEEDQKTIRVSLLGLIRYYVAKEITFEELSQLLSFIIAVHNETLVGEGLDLLLSLLEIPSKRDQLYMLMYEPDCADLLYVLLTKEYSTELKEKVLRIMSILLKTEKVYDKNKTRLRLQDGATYAGMTSLMSGSPVSLHMIRHMLDQVLLTDTAAGYDAALSILQLLHRTSLGIKLEASKKLLAAIFMSKSNSARLLARQLGWQEVIVRLFIQQPRPGVSSSSLSQDNSLNPFLDEDAAINDTNSAVTTSLPVDKDSNTNQENPENVGTLPDSESPPHLVVSDGEAFDYPSLSDSEVGQFRNSSRESTASAEEYRPGRSDSLYSLQSDNSLSPGDQLHSTEVRSPSMSSQLSNMLDSVAEQDTISQAMAQFGLRLGGVEEEMELTEELTQNLLIILFTIMWKGLEGADKSAWKARCQVFSAIRHTGESYELLRPEPELNRRLLEMMLQGCITDLKEAGQTNTSYTENAMHLVKLIYSFICGDEASMLDKLNERLIEDIMTLLDLMTVWDADIEWREMAQIGLSILITFAQQDDLDLCSIAAARLHTILQTRPVDKLSESCFVMAAIDSILTQSLQGQEVTDHYSFLIPVMKALVDKCHDLLNMSTYLPGLPATAASPTFFDDFKNYCREEEWRTFMEKQVLPSKEQYVCNMFDELKVAMNMYLGECHEEMMIASHKRSRDRGESKLRFQSQVEELFCTRLKQENKRYQNILAQLRNQHASALRQWRSVNSFFTGERGAWHDSLNGDPVFWKLSYQENFSRMRPKLIQNYNFDNHGDASHLRDNEGKIPEVDVEVSALAVIPEAKEAKVSDEEIGDDRLGDEEWNVISSASIATSDDTTGKEKLVLSEDCELVTIMSVFKGRLEVTTTHIYFFDSSSNKEEGTGEDFKLALAQLREIHFRRYNLRRSALELFLIDQSNYFLNFQKKIRNKVYSRILSLRPTNLIYYGSRSPAELLKTSGLTQKWVQREISNFDYLMQLNTIAGRTYNDLSQYPVFPWILKDYTSEILDVENPDVYRDLSKPIGVCNPKNEKEVKDKYDCFEDPTGQMEKFHYGTHYSNPAAVMHYLVRMEPYTSLHIQLQSGKFDVADRQFYSIPGTWQGLMDNPNDVKELTPEFFYLPEFLYNMNDFDLGKMQVSKEPVNHVELPKWASSAEDFIHLHRKALESEYVSAHLHEWIDLIFGFKQKGPAAAEALNVFYYASYEGAVDLDAVVDPMRRKALEGIINNFGQTPCQLLKEPHPKRMSFEEAVSRAGKADKPLNVMWFLNQLKAFYVEVSADIDPLAYINVPRNQARSFISHGMPDAMIGITEEGYLGVHGWLPYDKSISNYFTFERDPSFNNNRSSAPLTIMDPLAVGKAVTQKLGSLVVTRSRKCLAGPFSPGLHITPKLFVVSHDAKLIFTGGHWDNSLRVYSLAKSKTVSHIVRHTDIVTCVALDHCGTHLMTGSRDTTCMIWEVTHQAGLCQGLNSRPLQTLYGHDDEVTCVCISVELDMAVSGSKDGTVNMHTVRRGTYMRTLRPSYERGSLSLELMVMSDIGQLVLLTKQSIPGKSSQEDQFCLHLYSINGKLLSSDSLTYGLGHMAVADSHLITGSTNGQLVVRELFGLKMLTTVPLHVPVQCVSVPSGNSHIFVGLRDGKLIIVGIKKNPEVK